MTDEYLQGMIEVRDIQDAQVHYTYTPEQEAQRAEIIALIEAEKRAYMARVEPLVQKLGAIRGKQHIIIRSGLR